jgi:DNA-binding cell septation regulator SpoVG
MLAKSWVASGKAKSFANLLSLCEFETSSFLTESLSVEEREVLGEALQEGGDVGGQVHAALAFFHNLRAYEDLLPQSLAEADWKALLILSESGILSVISSVSIEAQALLFSIAPTPLAARWYQLLSDSAKDKLLRAAVEISFENEVLIRDLCATLLKTAKGVTVATPRASAAGRNLKFLLKQHDPIAEAFAEDLTSGKATAGSVTQDALEDFVSFEDALRSPPAFLAEFFVECDEMDLAALLLCVREEIVKFITGLLPQQRSAALSQLARNLNGQSHRRNEIKSRAASLKNTLAMRVQESFRDEIQERKRQRQRSRSTQTQAQTQTQIQPSTPKRKGEAS